MAEREGGWASRTVVPLRYWLCTATVCSIADGVQVRPPAHLRASASSPRVCASCSCSPLLASSAASLPLRLFCGSHGSTAFENEQGTLFG